MQCRRCQAENPASAKFCMTCGGPLESACPQCGAGVPGHAKFCPDCGRQLQPTAAPPAQTQLRQYIPPELLAKLDAVRAYGGTLSERRVVTMLFCDVKGSTAAAEKLDPEEWAEIMNGAFEHLIASVYRYEGTLARLMGDAILAFFGAPIAHEDDPQRAVLAALDIVQGISSYAEEVKRRWGLDFTIRAGINTGLVVVGEVGSDLRVEYTAMGDAVNLAARMEQTAEPGAVHITDETYKLIAPFFDCQDLGEVAVKGKNLPVRAYRILRAKPEPGQMRGIEGMRPPLIGREEEMARLQAAIAELRQGRGQALSVIGDAGLGKSRLIAELRDSLASRSVLRAMSSAPDTEPEDGRPAVAWHEGRSLSYASSTPYALFHDLLSDCFDLRPEDGETEKYAKIVEQLRTLTPDRPADGELAPYLAAALGLPVPEPHAQRVGYLDPAQLRAEVFRAVRAYIARLAARSPTVLVFEDLHWSDSASLDLLQHLLPLTDEAMLCILTAFRPQRQELSWRFHETALRDYAHRYTPITLQPLDEGNARTFVASLLPIAGLSDGVRDLILKKTEGNPFFVEEVVRSLLDAKAVVQIDGQWRATREIEDIALPNTVAGVLTTRLDRLDEDARRVVQTASVIGRDFQFATLTDVHEAPHVLDKALTELQRRGLIREKSRLPLRAYTFEHALTQEAAYNSLLLSRRRSLHKRVAEFFERHEPRRVNDIGRHFAEAGELVRALPLLVEAGDNAARAFALPEAVKQYSQAIDITQKVKDISLTRRSYEGLAGAHLLADDMKRAVETYQKMREFAETIGEKPMQVSACNKMGFVCALRLGELSEAEKMLADAERLATECLDYPGLYEHYATQCFISTTTGRFANAMEHMSNSARIGQDSEHGEFRLLSLEHTSTILTFIRRFDEAWEMTQEALRLAHEFENRAQTADILAVTGFLHYLLRGELDQAQRTALDAVKIAKEAKALQAECAAAMMLGMLALYRGEYEDALHWEEHAVQIARAGGTPFYEAAALSVLGSAHFSLGNSARASELHTQALYLMQHPIGMLMAAIVWSEAGFSSLERGDLEKADEMFEKGLTVPSGIQYLWEPQLLAGRAFVALRRGQVEEAGAFVSNARSVMQEGLWHTAPLVALAEGHVSAANGDHTEALERYGEAERLAAGMGMRPVTIQARWAQAQALMAMGRTAEARAASEVAHAMIEEIAGLLSDDTLRAQFLAASMDKMPAFRE